MEAVSEVIRFQPNVPVRPTLKYDSPKPCKSRFSQEDQYMITATDGRIAFLTPYANARLEAAGVKRGDEVTITQTVVVKGQRKTVDWVITKPGEDSGQGSATAAVPAAAQAVPAVNQVNQQSAKASVTGGRPATQLEDALMTAMAAAKAAEHFGQEIGYFVKFDKDDVRSMAITLLIGRQQRGDR